MSFASRFLLAVAIAVALALAFEAPHVPPVHGAPAAAPLLLRAANASWWNLTFFNWEDCSGTAPLSADTYEVQNDYCSAFSYPICQGTCAGVMLVVDPVLAVWNLSVWETFDCTQMPTYSSGKLGVCSEHPLIPYNFIVETWNASEPTKDM